MHILDGHLPPPTIVGGFIAAGSLTALTLPKLADASPPRVAMVTSAFFVSSLLAFPFLSTKVHLSLLGIAGIVLGRAAFPSVLVGVVLQLALFGHGGFQTLGVNATTMGFGALIAGGVFRLGPPKRLILKGALAGALGTLSALALYGGALLTAGEHLEAVAWACVVVHLPVIAVEAIVTAQVVGFLQRVRPDLLPGFQAETAS